MFFSADARYERFWRVGIGRDDVFFHSFVASKARKVSSEKRGGAEDRLPKMATKFAPRLRARAIWKSKSSKTGGVGALLEVERGKICTTLWRESDLEVKIVKIDGLGTFLEVQSAFCMAGAGVREGCRNFGRRGGIEEGRKRCFSSGRRRECVICDVDV